MEDSRLSTRLLRPRRQASPRRIKRAQHVLLLACQKLFGKKGENPFNQTGAGPIYKGLAVLSQRHPSQADFWEF
jgi:hypothetical protein